MDKILLFYLQTIIPGNLSVYKKNSDLEYTTSVIIHNGDTMSLHAAISNHRVPASGDKYRILPSRTPCLYWRLLILMRHKACVYVYFASQACAQVI